MSDFKGTPGPWVVDNTNTFGVYGVWTNYPTHPGHDGTGYGDQICDMLTVSFKQADQKTRPQRDANAKLIAASPDLLAACEAMVAIRDTQRKRESEEFHLSADSFMAMWDEAEQKCRAALAKAMGQTA